MILFFLRTTHTNPSKAGRFWPEVCASEVLLQLRLRRAGWEPALLQLTSEEIRVFRTSKRWVSLEAFWLLPEFLLVSSWFLEPLVSPLVEPVGFPRVVEESGWKATYRATQAFNSSQGIWLLESLVLFDTQSRLVCCATRLLVSMEGGGPGLKLGWS